MQIYRTVCVFSLVQDKTSTPRLHNHIPVLVPPGHQKRVNNIGGGYPNLVVCVFIVKKTFFACPACVDTAVLNVPLAENMIPRYLNLHTISNGILLMLN